MNGDEARSVGFRRRPHGYDLSQVDDLLRRIAGELDAGRAAGPLIAGAEFRPAGTMVQIRQEGIALRREVTGSPEYDTAAVDWFLDQLRRQEDRSDLAADPWRDLPVANYFTRKGLGGLGDRTATPAREAHQEQADPDQE